MFTPTKKELEELGFEIDVYYEWKFWYAFTKVWPYIEYKWFKNMWKVWMRQFYPESLEDIKTLIRLLTPSL